MGALTLLSLIFVEVLTNRILYKVGENFIIYSTLLSMVNLTDNIIQFYRQALKHDI